MKKVVSILFVLVLVLSLLPGALAENELKGIKIGIIGYQESGEPVTAINNFMTELNKATGLEYIYVCGSSYDEQTNLTHAQNLISSGCNGIIMCMDSAMPAIMEECQMAEVYVGGFLCDMDRSLETLAQSPYFVGTVCDGAYNNACYGHRAAELVIADGKKNIGLLTSSYRYYPHKKEAVEAFQQDIEAYNATASDADKITVAEVEEIAFKPLDATYFANHPDMDAIVSFAAGTFIYPTMVAENRLDLKLYTVGFESEDSFLDNMRSGVCGMQTYGNTEAVVYPLALMINAIQGNRYADQPEKAERQDSSVVFVTTGEEIDAVMAKSFYLNPVIENSFLSVDDVKNMILSYNPDATYAELTGFLTHMGIEDIMAK